MSATPHGFACILAALYLVRATVHHVIGPALAAAAVDAERAADLRRAGATHAAPTLSPTIITLIDVLVMCMIALLAAHLVLR